MKNRNSADNKKGRVVAFLTRDEIDFVDKLSKDALFSTGHRLSRTDIIGAIIDVVKESKISANGVSTKLGLEKKLLLLIKNPIPCPINVLKKEERPDVSY